MLYDLEIIIPVFHEEGNILKTLNNILEKVNLNYRIIVVYDHDEDPTIKVIKDNFLIFFNCFVPCQSISKSTSLPKFM